MNGAATTRRWASGAPTTAIPARTACKWWGIGNEMYGDWQLGHMPLAEYVKKHNRVVDAMRAVDPDDRAGGGRRGRRLDEDRC